MDNMIKYFTSRINSYNISCIFLASSDSFGSIYYVIIMCSFTIKNLLHTFTAIELSSVEKIQDTDTNTNTYLLLLKLERLEYT
jgi:hypothetical protein